jgi:predicted dehydrogenase
MKKINWGIIGLGNIALKFAQAFQYTKNARLKGISSNNKLKLENFQKEFHVDKNYCFDNYQDLVDSKDIDIIYIAIPNSLHSKWIIECLKKEKKVLVEKPAAMNALEILDIKKNYYNNTSFFAEGFMYMYHPQIKKTFELLNEGKIGKVISMESSFGKDILSKKSFFGFKKRRKLNEKSRLFNKKLGGGAILDLGCYPVSFSVLVASLISKIDYDKIKISNIQKEIGNTGVDLDAYAELDFKNDFKSIVAASFTRDIGTKTKIVGTKGKIILESSWHGEPSEINIIGEEKKNIKFPSNDNVFFYEIETLSHCILKGIEKKNFPKWCMDETLGNMKILDKWLG